MAEAVIDFDPASLGAEPVTSDFDPSSLGAEPVDSFDPASLGAQPVDSGVDLGDKSSRFLASAAEGGLQAVAGGVRVAQALNPKLASFFDSVAKDMGGAPISEFLTELQGAGSRAKDDYGVNPKEEGKFTSQLASGAGSLLPTLASGPAAPITNALMMGEQGLQEAQDVGGTEIQQARAFIGNAAVGAATEYLLGLPALLKSVKATGIPEKTFRSLVSSVTKQAAKHFVREGSQETLEQVAQDTIAKYLASYDKDREVFDPKKLAMTFLIGGTLGAVVGGGLQLAENASPEQIAPKEEMQTQAETIDQALASIAEVPPPLPTQTEQGTPVLSPQEIAQVPPGTPADLQAASEPTPEVQTTSAPPEQQPQAKIVSTGIQTPEGIARGKDWNTKHADIIQKNEMIQLALAEGMTPDELDANKGFIVQDETGKERFVGRKEALEIGRKSGQVNEDVLYSASDQGLISEALVQPTEKPNVQQTQETKASPEEVAQALQPHFQKAVYAAEKAGATDPESAASEAQIELSNQGKADPALFVTAARRKGLDQAKKAKPQEEVGEVPTERGPRAAAVSQEEVGSIQEAVSKLPENDRKVMESLMDDPSLTAEEVAEQHSLTVDQVKKAKSRAREVLKEFIRSQGIGTRMAPGASSIREIRNARYVAGADIYQGLKESGQLTRATWEKNMNRLYEDVFDQEELDNVWAVAQYAEENRKETGKPFIKIIDQISGGESGTGLTSIKNAQADVERRARGLPQAMAAARRTQPGVWDEAIRNMEEKPQFQSQLISRLRNDPRSTVNDLELMTLLHAKVEAENAYERAIEGVNQVPDPQTRLEALSIAREAESKLLEIYDLAKTVGSEQGRAFAARKMLVSRDYSVGRLTAELTAENQGELSDKQRELVSQVSENVQRLESEQDARQAQLEQELAQKQAEETLSDLKKEETLDPAVKSIVDRILERLDKAANAARKRLKERLQYTSTGLDPTILYDLSVIGASKIAHGIVKFSRWSASMTEEFGDGIKPYLKDAFDQANQRVEREVEGKPTNVKKAVRDMSSEEIVDRTSNKIRTKVEGGQSLNELRADVRSLSLAFARSGVDTVEKMNDAVHSVLSPLIPGITKRQVMDLWSGYGDLKSLDPEEAKVRLRDLKGQAQNLAKLEDLEKGQEPLKTGIERRKPSFAERQLIQAVNAARARTGIGTMEAYKARLQNQIADLEARIQKKDFAKRPRKQLDISKDAEMVRLIAEAERWKKRFLDAKYEARKAGETKLQTAIRYGKEALNVPRAIKSSLDFSAVLRQGGVLAFGNPVRAAKALGPMFKAAFSEKTFNQQEAAIRNRPNAPLYKSSKLYLADMEGSLTNREETFRSEFSDKLPGVKASNRAFIGFLNKLRADSFDAMVGSLTTSPTPEQLKAISHFINVATGRGDLGSHGAAAETLATVLWSPRLLVSRMQLLAVDPILRGNAAGVRKVIAKEYAKTLTGVAVVMALGALAGAEIEKDPRSSDFGKLKFGNTRIDPWMGLQQITVLGSRLGTQETKTQGGKTMSLKKTDDKKRPPWAETSADVIARFLRTKLTPLLGTSIDVLSGENVVGEKVTPFSTAKDLVVPLSLGDIYDLMKEQGMEKGTILEILNLFGMSTQTYQEKKSKH